MKKFRTVPFVPALLCAVMLTGCGAAGGSDNGSYQSAEAKSYDSYEGEAYAETAAAGYLDDYSGDEYYNGGEAEEPQEKSDYDDNARSASMREMLVYSCNMSLDTLDFNGTVEKFRELLDGCGGFIETENYSDGGGGGRWYYENEEKWQSYSATVRVPSKDYDSFCGSVAELGDLRSKTASVENLSQEYSDLATTLEIYEAKEQRYIALLAEITDDEYAVAIEKELTEIEIQIANIKTRMNTISTGVAYSYVYLSINEVKEYSAEPVKTDTFWDRLKNTLSDTGSGFVEFLEAFLFFIIRIFPYAVIIGIIVVIIVVVHKKRKAKRPPKPPVQPVPYTPYVPPVQPVQAPEQPVQPEAHRNDDPHENDNNTDS